MNKPVLIALRRPCTFVVLSILIVLFGSQSIVKSPTEGSPNIRIPALSVVWSYAGLMPGDVSGRNTFFFEPNLTAAVGGFEHLTSHPHYGSSINNICLHPEINLAGAEAEIDAISQTVMKMLPPDISRPMNLRLEASSVPVATLQVASDTQIRNPLVTIRGPIVPLPYGGKPAQMMTNAHESPPFRDFARNTQSLSIWNRLSLTPQTTADDKHRNRPHSVLAERGEPFST